MKRLITFSMSIFVVFTTLYAATEKVIIRNPDTWTANELSQYVGQTITFETPFYVVNNYYIGKQTLTISPRRIFSPTNQVLPGSVEYNTLVSANNTGTVTLTNQNTYRRMGEKILNLTVKVQNTSTLVPVGSVTFEGNTRESMTLPPNVGNYNLKVCGFNLEYYLVENYGSGTMGPCDAAEQNAQHAKITKALVAIDADIYGLVEIEQGQVALAKLATALNQAKGINTFTYINDGGSSYGTYTKVGFLYNSAKVKPYGALQNNNTGVNNRKKIQAFTLIENDEKFVFSLNHFKAKSSGGSGMDADQYDGQGGYNASRVAEAESVATMLKNKQTYFGDEDILVMGDLNAYAKEDPIKVFTDLGYIDLHRAYHADSSYSYTYRGQIGYLDHALANSTLYMQTTGMSAYHINSDEHDNYTYNGSWNDGSMFRCSDHDPVIVGLQLGVANNTLKPFADRVKINTAEFYQGSAPLTISNAENSYLYIYNIYGIEMLQNNINSAIYTVNTSSMKSGVYIMNIYGEGVLKQVKIIVP